MNTWLTYLGNCPLFAWVYAYEVCIKVPAQSILKNIGRRSGMRS
jgi:hypothetical protein